jgi:hypothetical protein
VSGAKGIIQQELLTFETRHADIMIWFPKESVSGEYEALIGGELVKETDGRRFLRALKERIRTSQGGNSEGRSERADIARPDEAHEHPRHEGCPLIAHG